MPTTGVARSTSSTPAPSGSGSSERIRYDYLINATGPQLKFGMTPGLGPDGGNTVSVCTADHAVHAAAELTATIERLKAGQPQTLVVGMGHGTCTCEGAAFEYVFNVDHELREAGVRDLARLVYLTNEAQLGDFGVDGMTFDDHGFETTSRAVDIEPVPRARRRSRCSVRTCIGSSPASCTTRHSTARCASWRSTSGCCFRPFGGVPLQAFDRDGGDITAEVFAPSGFMKVDADYTAKPYEEWRGADWPKTYQSVGLPERVRRRDRLRSAASDLTPAQEPERHRDRTVAAPHRDAVGRHGQDRGPDDRGPDQAWQRPPGARGLDGATWARRASPQPEPACDAAPPQR